MYTFLTVFSIFSENENRKYSNQTECHFWSETESSYFPTLNRKTQSVIEPQATYSDLLLSTTQPSPASSPAICFRLRPGDRFGYSYYLFLSIFAFWCPRLSVLDFLRLFCSLSYGCIELSVMIHRGLFGTLLYVNGGRLSFFL